MVKASASRVLSFIETWGNRLPNPVSLFVILTFGVALLSALISALGISAIHPATGKTITPVNLLSIEGLHLLLTKMVSNFTGFAPLGTVLVSMLGIGLLEGSGYISTVLRLVVSNAPRKLLTMIVVFSGVMSNMAGEIGYVLLVPLSASLFLAAGRHPLAGFAAAFAGVSGGYSANLLLGSIDPLLAGLTQEGARIIDPNYSVNAAANYYFMFVSTFVITIAGTFVTERIVIPRLGKYQGAQQEQENTSITPAEKKGLWYTGIVLALFTAFILGGLLPENGYLRDPKTFDVLHSPFMSGIVAFIFLGGAAVGISFGFGAGTFTGEKDVVKSMSKSLETMAGYIVLVFFAAQFVAFFQWSNIGAIIAISGASFLKSSGLGAIPLLLSFILISALVNLFIGSASAKWALMAPIFVPMFMLLGYTPELTQAAYRVGDSVTNIISPMMSYFVLLISYMEKYRENSGIGSLIATMLPYSITFFIVWSILLVAWYFLGLPLGPGAELHLQIK